MRMKYNLFNIILTLFSLASCSEGEIFGPKKAPIPGERLNVLHYDLSRDNAMTEKDIKLPKQKNLASWEISDIGQFTGLPENISLGKNISLKKSIYISNFNKSAGSSFIIIDGVIYTYSANVLSAFDIDKQQNIWSTNSIVGKEKNDIISGTIAYHDGVIYLSSGVEDFIAYDIKDGKEKWRFKMSSVVRNIPLIHDNKIYISGIDNTLVCLDLEGNLIWRYDAAIYSLVSNRLYLPNIIYEDKIINITTAGDLLVLNRYDGSEITQVNLSTTAIIGDGSLAKGPLVSPVLNGSNLYILTGESDYIKINLSIPEISWRHNFPNAKSFWIIDQVTYMITRSNQLIAIDNKNGKMIWMQDLSKNSENKKDKLEFYGPILAGDNLVITSRSGELLLISPYDGSEVARYDNYTTHQMPVVVNNELYFFGKLGHIAIWH